MIRLALGGEKSGKSDFALDALLRGPAPRLFLATGQPADLSFREQILAHRVQRPASIPVREVGAELPQALRDAAEAGVRSLLADSLDFWLFLCLERPAATAEDALLASLAALPRERIDVTFVSCEIGLGPIAADAATRSFVRRLGKLNAAVAAVCDSVDLIVAGLPLALKRL
jgi:adenosylcobinamide kinase/adenosylcobinamide-phosphate guanylyltransferase